MNNKLSIRITPLLFTMALSGCSLLVSVESTQCESNSDCAGLSDGVELECVSSVCQTIVDKTFGCQDSPWSTPNIDESVDYKFLMLGLLSQAALPGVELSVCSSIGDCETPITTGVSDESGNWNVPLNVGFRGYIRSNETTIGDAVYPPALFYPFPPPTPEIPYSLNADARLMQLDRLIAIAGGLGVTVDPAKGVVFFAAYDCEATPMAGARVVATPKSNDTYTAYLGESGTPDVDLTETGTIGFGTILNLDPGTVMVTVTNSDTGDFFRQTLRIEPGTITVFRAYPSPLD